MSNQDAKSQMDKAVDHLRTELSRMRVGRASTAMVEAIKVSAYGSDMGLKELAALATPDAKTISIQPWDVSLIGAIEKSLLAANLGLTPANDGKLIRLNMPPMTEDRRKEIVKEIKRLGEETKVSIRNIRRSVMDGLKATGASEDEIRRSQDQIQKTTDASTTLIDEVVNKKSDEIMKL